MNHYDTLVMTLSFRVQYYKLISLHDIKELIENLREVLFCGYKLGISR